MSTKTSSPSGSLNIVIVAAIVAWAVTFAAVHGAFVFGYIAMHAATTGVFLLAIRRSDKNRVTQVAAQPGLAKASASVSRPSSERVARPQPVA